MPEFEEPIRQPSRREVEVLTLISEGLTDDQIGRELRISTHTVKSHVRHLLGKLRAHSRAHAIAVAYQQGMLEV